jgi:hypothetical protein
MPARTRIEILLHHLPSGRALNLRLHEWQPAGGAYAGLPLDRGEARRRRQERVVVQELGAGDLPPPAAPPPQALGEYCLDLRRV